MRRSTPRWEEVKPWSQDWLIAAGAYPGFCSMKRLEVFILPLDGMLVHRRLLPRNLLSFPNNLWVPIYTPGWREAVWEYSVLPKNTTQCPRPGLEPGPLAPESNALTIKKIKKIKSNVFFFCTEASAFDNTLMHESFAERWNAKRTGAYLPFLEKKVIEFAWRKEYRLLQF